MWKYIPGYDNKYRINENGLVQSRAQSVDNIEWKEMHQQITEKGYRRVHLSKNRKSRAWRVHRLVAKLFLSPATNPKRIFVNHKDTDKTNNHFSNLEWCTHAENIQHAKMMGLMKNSGCTGKPIRLTLEFPNMAVAARFFNVSTSAVETWMKGAVPRGVPVRVVEFMKEDDYNSIQDVIMQKRS